MNEVMQFRTADFNRQLDALVKLTGKSVAEVLTSEGRLFTADVIKLTPPFSGAPSSESFNAQRKAGEAAVERDIKRVYITPTDAEDGLKIGRFQLKIETPEIKERLQKLIRKKDTNGIRELLKSINFPVNEVMVDVDPFHHTNRRDRRGRVQRESRLANVVLKMASLNAYIRKMKTHVGKAKAGWAAAASALGVKLPSWITRHAKQGQFIDKRKDWRNPSITIANLVGYIQSAGTELRIVSRALENRAVVMKAKMEKIIASGWKKKGY